MPEQALKAGWSWRLIAGTLGIRRYLALRRALSKLLRRSPVAIDPKPLITAHLQSGDRRLRHLVGELAGIVTSNLQQLEAGLWSHDDDSLFAPHTALVSVVWRYYGLAFLPIDFWDKHLRARVEQAEKRIGRHIHKGAPLYNVALCHFRTGDLVHAAQYMDAAGEEDERTRPGSGRSIITGSGIAEGLLIDPLFYALHARHGNDYRSALGVQLTKPEFVGLVQHMTSRPSDAVTMLFGFWRVQSLEQGPDSYAARLQRVRGLADILVAFESSIARWQGPISGQLKSRLDLMLRGNGALNASFNAIDRQYAGSDWTQASILNRLVSDETTRFRAATSRIDAAASALYATFRLRNSLMHVLEDQLDIMTSRTKLYQMMGFALISVALSWRAAGSSLGSI